MDTPISEPASPGIAPVAGDGVAPSVVPDSVPVVATSPGSAPLSLILGGFLALLLSAWAGIVPFIGPSFGFSADGTASWTWNLVHGLGDPARRGRPARLSRYRRDCAPPDRHARCSSARQRRVRDLPVRGVVRVGPSRLARARRQLLPCRVAVFDPGLLDGTCDRTRCSARRFRCIRDGACWTGVTRELLRDLAFPL